MRRRKEPPTARVTHRYVIDPEAAERGRQTWAMLVAEQLRRKVAEELQEQQEAERLLQ